MESERERESDGETSAAAVLCVLGTKLPSSLLFLQTSVQGRVQVNRVMAASIDNNIVSGLLPFSRSPGAIRVMTCGSGPQLLKASIDVSNNYIFGKGPVITRPPGISMCWFVQQGQRP